VSIVAATAAVAALDDSEHVALSMRRTANDRQEFLNQANARMVRTIDSQASFVMLKPSMARRSSAISRHKCFSCCRLCLFRTTSVFPERPRYGPGVWDLMPHHISMSM
jgi:histidinol-phosphate/aromatic aminotransferase/cobyric acid decarboxylase-like protein